MNKIKDLFYYPSLFIAKIVTFFQDFRSVVLIDETSCWIYNNGHGIDLTPYPEKNDGYIQTDFNKQLQGMGMCYLPKKDLLAGTFGYNTHLWNTLIFTVYNGNLCIFKNKPFQGFTLLELEEADRTIAGIVSLLKTKDQANPDSVFSTKIYVLTKIQKVSL